MESTTSRQIDIVASAIYDRVKRVPTLTFAIAYPDEQEQFRDVARIAIQTYRDVTDDEAAEMDDLNSRITELEEQLREVQEDQDRLQEIIATARDKADDIMRVTKDV